MSYIPPNKGVRNWGRNETVTTCHRLTQLWEHPGLCREGENKPAASQKTRLSRQFPLLLGKKIPILAGNSLGMNIQMCQGRKEPPHCVQGTAIRPGFKF